MLFLPLLFIFGRLVLLARCLRNVTVDDNDSQIQYTGDWGRSVETDLNYGRSHVLTTNPTSQAVFQFTGVAVYFLSPLWPYAVSTALTLDSRPTNIVDLTDLNSTDAGGGPETVGSNVVWSAENLTNSTHTLRISIGRGQQFAIVDGITYTVLEPGDASPTRGVAGPTAAASSSDNAQNQVLPIALGTVLGVLALILIGLILWLCLGRRKDTSNTRGGRSRMSAGDMSSVSEQGGAVPPRSPPLSPAGSPRFPFPTASRPDSNYQPGETAWSTSSVGGPGVPNMTGVGVSVRNSRVDSGHQNFAGMQGQGDNHGPSTYPDGPYISPNRDSKYPDI